MGKTNLLLTGLILMSVCTIAASGCGGKDGSDFSQPRHRGKPGVGRLHGHAPLALRPRRPAPCARNAVRLG